MANHKSCEKRAKSSQKKRTRNSEYLGSVKTAVKKVRIAVASYKIGGLTDQKKITNLLSEATSLLHKAATKRIIHPQNASRNVSRLTLAVKKAFGAEKA